MPIVMLSQDNSIQQTKLYRPFGTAGLLARPRLLDLLDAGRHGTLTLVVSPPGSGKSSLVSQWLDDRAIDAAWLQLDAGDSEPAKFIAYVVHALRTIAPDFGVETLLLLRSARLPPLDVVTTTLSNELHELGETSPCLLVLDDYHMVKNPAIDQVMAGLVTRPPQGFRLLIISRRTPAWPLGRLRIEKRLHEIGAADLRFTREETAAYLQLNAIALPDDGMVMNLQRQTEGWATGLQLAILALRQQADVAGLLGSRPMFVGGDNRYLLDYMVEEVLAHLPESTVQFMLASAVCDRFCAPLCQRLLGLGRDMVDDLLRYLLDANLFLIPLEEGSQGGADRRFAWYRYHHLMHQSLVSRLEESFEPQAIATLHRNAAAWLREQGYVDEALGHLLAIADWDTATDVLVSELGKLLDREDRQAIAHWLTLLPEAEIARRPGLLLLRGWDCFFSLDLPLLAATLRDLHALADDTQHDGEPALNLHLGRQHAVEIEGHIAFLQCAADYFAGRTEEAIRGARKALNLLTRPNTLVHGNVYVMLGSAMQMAGQSSEAEAMLRTQYQRQRPKPTQASARLLFGLTLVLTHVGDYTGAAEAASLMLREAHAADLPLLVGWSHAILGRVHYERNELDAALTHFNAVTDRRYVVNRGCAYEGFTGRMLVAAAQGDEAALSQAGDEWRQFEESLWGFPGPLYHSVQARAALLIGDTPAALRWARTFTAPPPAAPMIWLEASHITKVRCLLAAADDAERAVALDLTNACIAHVEQMHLKWLQPSLSGLRALLLARTGARAEAVALLATALHRSRGEGFVRSYADLGPAIVDLLRAIDDTALAEPIAQIVAAIPGGASGQAAVDRSQLLAGPAALLTEREYEVLELLATPLTPHEIADALSVSYSTIRHHTSHIYEKLGVNKRRQAVLVAAELGLLP